MPLTTNHPMTTRPRAGFTLFEVAISLVIMTVGVLSVMMLMPIGIKAQQMARFQILASAKAIELMSVNANQWRKWDKQRLEGQMLGLCSINQIAQTPLMEQKACNWRHGSLPVPPEIARRLESDNDEIQQILSSGGYLFYSSPRPLASTDEENTLLEDKEIPNESQRLVYAFVGHAQQPALASHPCKAWPYYDWYPAPPRGRAISDASSPNSRHEDSWKMNSWPNLSDFEAVYLAWRTANNPASKTTDPTTVKNRELVVAYRNKAKELVAKLDMLGATPDANGIPGKPPGNTWEAVKPWKVLAAGYLAQSMVWLTSSQFPEASTSEIDQAKLSHERALEWLHRYTTTSPYDWGIDRALNFQHGWDQPLLQYQLFESTSATDWAPRLAVRDDFLKDTTKDSSWRILTGQTVENAGTSSSYGVTFMMAGAPAPGVIARPNGNRDEIVESWANQTSPANDTFNLTNDFQPWDRCRQVVFWAVDWKAYEDFETAPSAPMDASRIHYDSDGGASYNGGAHKFRNPERFFTFGKDTDGSLKVMESHSDSLINKSIYLGLLGADRNGNRRVDVGPVPASVRMRAISVARFNFYNPRVWTGLRN